MQFIPRGIYFKNGVGVSVVPQVCHDYDECKVVYLPTDHYDFIGPINIVGKTLDQIKTEAETYRAKS